MINSEDAALHFGLPPEQRFYLTEQLARRRLETAFEESEQYQRPTLSEFDYMTAVLAAAEVFVITELQDWELPTISVGNAEGVARDFRAAATKVSQKLMYRFAGIPKHDPNSASLSPAMKEKFRFHLGQVRSLIDQDPMPDWKKQEFYAAIRVLECELEKPRTSAAAVLEVVSKLWEGEKGVADVLRQIMSIYREAKSSEQQQLKLTEAAAPKLLEAPKPPVRKRKPAEEKSKKSGFEHALEEGKIPF